MKVRHLARPEGSTVKTHAGVIIEGESYRIDHLSKASQLCCSWLRLNAGRHKSEREWTQGQLMPVSMGRDSLASSRSAQDKSVVTHNKVQAAGPLLAAMHRKGLTAPSLAIQVRALLKQKGMTKLKVDRSTIYRLVCGKVKHPQPRYPTRRL